MTADRLFEESNEERIARLRRRFESGVERAESAHKKAVEDVATKLEAIDTAKQVLEDFDRAFAEKDRELELVDQRLRNALRVRGIDPGTGEVGEA